MTWPEVASKVLEKDLMWFVGASLLIALSIIGLWVYRSKKNGNGNGNGTSEAIKDSLQLDDRISMLEKDVAVIKNSIDGLSHWVDQSHTTALKQASEWGEFKAKLEDLSRRLDNTPSMGNKLN